MSKRIADNVIPISTPLNVSFFKAWLDFTAPLHNLTGKERVVMAHYLKKHYELSKVIMNDAINDDTIFNNLPKEKLRVSASFVILFIISPDEFFS